MERVDLEKFKADWRGLFRLKDSCLGLIVYELELRRQAMEDSNPDNRALAVKELEAMNG